MLPGFTTLPETAEIPHGFGVASHAFVLLVESLKSRRRIYTNLPVSVLSSAVTACHDRGASCYPGGTN
jgi:hypothetical protein